MNKIENVQRRFTKLIKNFHNLPYEERLKLINLPSFEYRQLRGDMIYLEFTWECHLLCGG